MAKIALREYIKEVENLIDRGETDQAISHCKHILKYYPKHIDTYRLLGKSFLEKQKYGDAADIFQRVLSSIPDDFISHIGMSIIREDENNQDAAIWHMERAFEVQPSNKAVQDELRRLYANRDGIAPPKIRLTRGALVRMYTRGDLYTQAIAEIRAALVEDPNRADLEVILARLYFLQGQHVEATEICSRLIEKLPYCYEANRILSEILPGTSREEDEKIFKQRVADLDPYTQFINDTLKTPADVADNAVMVDYLDWDPSQIESEQPDWAQSIGVEFGDEEQDNADLIDWANEIEEEYSQDTPQETSGTITPETPVQTAPPETSESLEAIIPETNSDDEVIPEWMQDAGWETSDGANVDAQKGFNVDMEEIQIPESDSEEIAPAEIPDWLQSMAPEDAEENALEFESSEEKTIADKDFEKMFESPASEAQDISEVMGQELADETIPGWLRDVNPDEENEDDSESVFQADDLETPDWLADLTEEGESQIEEVPAQGINLPIIEELQTSETTEQQTEAPAWLADLTSESDEITEPETTEEHTEPSFDVEEPEAAIPSAQEIEDKPDWLNELTDLENELTQDAPEPTPMSQDDTAPEWLSDLTGKSAANEDLPTTNQEEADESQEWLKSLTSEEAEPAQSEAPVNTEDASSTEDIPDWLSTLPETESTPESQLATDSEEDLDNTQDWLASLTSKDISQDGKPEEAAKAQDIPDWMQDLSALQSKAPEELKEEIEAESEEWLEGIQEDANVVSQEVESVSETPETDEVIDTPDWLKDLTDEQTATVSEKPIAETESEIPEIADGSDWVAEYPEESPEQESQEIIEKTISESIPAEETSIPAVSDTEMSEDDAFKWLEGLAAKQGAQDGTLLTEADERIEDTPEWIKDTLEAVEEPVVDTNLPEEKETEEMPQPEMGILTSITDENISEEETVISEQAIEVEPIASELAAQETELVEDTQEQEFNPAAIEGMDIESAMAWMEGLAAKQGADEETLGSEPEDRLEAPPSWVTDEAQEIIDEQAEDTIIHEQEPAIEADIQSEPTEEIGIPEPPLTELIETETDTEPEIVEQAHLTPEDVEAAIAEGIPTETLPPSDEYKSFISVSDETPMVEEVAVDQISETPAIEELEDTAELIQETKLEEQTEVEPVLFETKTEETDAIEDIPAEVETVEAIQEDVDLEDTETPEISTSPISEQLEIAKSALQKGNFTEALEIYNEHIQAELLLDQVIHDIKEALDYQYPIEISLWQALGDAYLRKDELDEALNAYSRAEELL